MAVCVLVCVCVCERDRQTDRQTDREGETELKMLSCRLEIGEKTISELMNIGSFQKLLKIWIFSQNLQRNGSLLTPYFQPTKTHFTLLSKL